MSFLALKIRVKSFSFFRTMVSFLLTLSAVSRNILLTTESASIRLFPGRIVLFVFVKSDSESLAKKIMLSTDFLMCANSSEREIFCSKEVFVEKVSPFWEDNFERESI
ncbi:hypothetical protein D3C81_1059690 [compost metagenome]